MARQYPFRSSQQRLCDIVCFDADDPQLHQAGPLVISPQFILLRVGASGGGGGTHSDGENQSIRQAALDSLLELFPTNTTVSWHQQGTLATHGPEQTQRSIADCRDDPTEPALRLAGNHSKWIALLLSDDTSPNTVLEQFDALIDEHPNAPAGFGWLTPTSDRVRIPESTQAMLSNAIEASSLNRTMQMQTHAAKPTASSKPNSAATNLLNRAPNLILEGVPGTGKSHAILALKKSTYGDRVTTIVMHPATGYEDLIEGVRPANGELGGAWNLKPRQDARYFHECYGKSVSASTSNGQGPFTVRGGHFLIACANACANPTQKFLLVLDEINRCNVPRAFGELLLLIEASKRWEWNDQDNRWEGGHGAILPYSGLTFFVPDNLHVLGTMNTTDRSVAPLDQALRRRFAFHRIEPMEPDELKAAIGARASQPPMAGSIDAWHALNRELEDKLGPDMMLGHSYFFDAARAMSNGTVVDAAIRDMWRFAILPQLIDILHSTNKAELAKQQSLASHLKSLELELLLKGEGLHALLRVRSTDSKANG